MGTNEALTLGLIDQFFANDVAGFVGTVKQYAADLANSSDYAGQLQQKYKQRITDEAKKPLQQYRDEELERMHTNFYGFDPSYHVARYNFVYKVPKSRTPLTIAQHRQTGNSQRRIA